MKAELRIIVSDNGAVTVEGLLDGAPVLIENKGLCYSLLECARDAIKDYNDTRQSGVVPADAATLALVRPS